MLRDAEGHVVFLQSWWRASLLHAANAIGRWRQEVEAIQADPVIHGQTSIYRRYYKSTEFKAHEAFVVGAEVVVRFLLPYGLDLPQFQELLSVAGRYAGLSPYRGQSDWGRFEVLSVVPVGTKEKQGALGESQH
jgi:hypothetical protein